MEVGQIGKVGRTVTLRAAMVGRFESVTATNLHRRTTAKIVEKTTGNTSNVSTTVVVQNVVFIASTS